MDGGDYNIPFAFLKKRGNIDHIWALPRENLLWGFVNNNGTDQPAHLHSLISAIIFHLMESIISQLATGEISIF